MIRFFPKAVKIELVWEYHCFDLFVVWLQCNFISGGQASSTAQLHDCDLASPARRGTGELLALLKIRLV